VSDAGGCLDTPDTDIPQKGIDTPVGPAPALSKHSFKLGQIAEVALAAADEAAGEKDKLTALAVLVRGLRLASLAVENAPNSLAAKKCLPRAGHEDEAVDRLSLLLYLTYLTSARSKDWPGNAPWNRRSSPAEGT
jgi:hypothetical protein